MSDYKPGTDRWVRVATTADGRPGTGSWIKRPASETARPPVQTAAPGTDQWTRVTPTPDAKPGTGTWIKRPPTEVALEAVPSDATATVTPSPEGSTTARTVRTARSSRHDRRPIVWWCLWAVVGTLLAEIQAIAWLANGVFRQWEGDTQLALFGMPFNQAVPWLRIDHWVHALVAGTAVWWCHWLIGQPRRPWAAVAYVSALATIDEASQTLSRSRTPEWWDWGTSMAGVAMAAGLILLVRAVRRRRVPRPNL